MRALLGCLLEADGALDHNHAREQVAPTRAMSISPNTRDRPVSARATSMARAPTLAAIRCLMQVVHRAFGYVACFAALLPCCFADTLLCRLPGWHGATAPPVPPALAWPCTPLHFSKNMVFTKYAWVAATTSEAAALAAAKAKEAAAAALSQASSAFGFLKNSVAGTSIGSSLLSKVGNLSVGAGGDDGVGVRAVQSSIISCRRFPRL